MPDIEGVPYEATGTALNQATAAALAARHREVASAGAAAASEAAEAAAEEAAREADRAEAAAEEAAGAVTALSEVRDRLPVAVDVPHAGDWIVGDDWRGLDSGVAVASAREAASKALSVAPVAVDVPRAGLWLLGDDWRAIESGGASASGAAEVRVDVPRAGDWIMGDDWRGVDRTAVPSVVGDPATSTAAHLATARALWPDVGTGGASPVTFIWDDYPDATLEHVVPLFAQHGVPWGWALNGGTFSPGHLLAPTEGDRTWADIAALDPAQVEIINHGWSHATVSSVEALDQEIRQSAARLRERTGQRVLGFTAPSVRMPGIDFTDMDRSSPAQFVGTPTGDAIRREHAWWTSAWKRAGDTAFTWTFPRRGWPAYAGGGHWVDAGPAAVEQQKARVDLAIERGHGLIIRGHAKAVADGRISTADLAGLLTHITAHRDAGRVTTLLPTPWMLSDTTA